MVTLNAVKTLLGISDKPPYPQLCRERKSINKFIYI